MRKILMLLSFTGLYTAANILVSIFGPAITPFNALVIIAADMVLRDRLQYDYGFAWSMGACVIAGLSTVVIAPEADMIAIASTVSVVASGLAAAAAFRFKGGSFYSKAFPANLVAAAVDSALFPLIAFGCLMPGVSLAQFVAKSAGATLILYLLKRFSK